MRRQKALRVTASAASLVVALTTMVLSTGPAAAQTDDTPSPPANVRVTELDSDSISIAWDPVPGATSYQVWTFARLWFPSPTVTIDGLTARIDGLMFDLEYRVYVGAKVPGYWSLLYSSILVTTPLPDGYEKPTTPTNFRLERNEQGEPYLFRWDASTGFGTLHYDVHALIRSSFGQGETILTTTELDMEALNIPICNGCEYSPDQVFEVWVVAHDKRHHASPPSDRIILSCCPF